MLWRIRDRGTFLAFRSHGIRARSGPVTVTFVPPDHGLRRSPEHPSPVADPPRVAFAIGKKVGHAVERNRLRRRLRAILVEVDPRLLPTGAYLVTGHADAVPLPYRELREHVERALTRINTKAEPGPAGKAGR